MDAPAVIEALKSGKVGSLGLDVYEEEADLFFEDLSDRVITDDVFSRLLTSPTVLITGHTAFFTREALHEIADTTVANLTAFARDDCPGARGPRPALSRTGPVRGRWTGRPLPGGRRGRTLRRRGRQRAGCAGTEAEAAP